MKTAVVFSLLFLPYVFFRRDTFFGRNRFYLITILFLSILIPLFSLPETIQQNSPSYILPLLKMGEKMNPSPENSNAFQLPLYIFYFISVLFVLRLIYALLKIAVLIYQTPKERNGNKFIVWVKNTHGFSFFHFIFLSKENYHPRIHAHENVHAEQLHSADILIFELYLCFQWFNPLVWLAIREIKAQHEYQADAIVSADNKYEYQSLLLSSVLDSSPVFMTHTFYCLTIKERLKMMNKNRSPKKALLKTAWILPFAVVSLGLAAGVNVSLPKENSTNTIVEQEENIVMPEFKGGNEALMKFMTDNIRYPEKARKENTKGKVFIKFVVSKEGKVKNAEILKGVSKDLDEEALRVVKAMPDWKPGTKNGKAADVEMTLPIMFAL